MRLVERRSVWRNAVAVLTLVLGAGLAVIGMARPATAGTAAQAGAVSVVPAGARAASAATPASGYTDPNLGYHYDIPSADDCRRNTRSGSAYGWRKNHYAYCQVSEVTGRIWDIDDPARILATYAMRLTTIGKGSFTARNATLTVTADQVRVTQGALPPGLFVKLSLSCTGDPARSCVSATQPYDIPFGAWEGRSVTFTVNSPNGVGSTTHAGRNAAFADGRFHVDVQHSCPLTGTCTESSVGATPDGHLRFDGPGSTAMNHRLGATFEPVDDGDDPVVDTLAYVYNGSYGGRSYAEASRHYYVALNFPNNSYPQQPPKNIPHVLTRLADGALADAGRDGVAIPLCRQVWGTAYATRFGRPLQCDEFPFAATYQGSPMSGGRPDPRRISVCPIAGPDNGAAGNAEQAFFMQQRIFDDVDHFGVTVINVPTPAPTAAQADPCPTP